jgi:hypothetical protein
MTSRPRPSVRPCPICGIAMLASKSREDADDFDTFECLACRTTISKRKPADDEGQEC